MVSRISDFCNRHFVWVVLLAACLGYVLPAGFLWVGEPIRVPAISSTGSANLIALPVDGIILGLGLIMFGMGMTLSFSDFREAVRNPSRIGLGVLLQFLIMPLVAFGLVVVLNLSTPAALGVILVGCCPGGTASNVIAFLAEADVPLSVSITLGSTLLAPVVTPWLVWFYGQKLMGAYRGEIISIPVLLLMKTILVIVVPLVIGLMVKRLWQTGETSSMVDNLFTLISILIISLIVAYVVATASVNDTLFVSLVLFVPVVLHNLIGLGLGYGGASYLSFPLDSMRSVSIEVGMQNSGLAVALAEVLRGELVAAGGYGPDELSLLAIPAVLFSVWHNITGPMLASRWSRSS